MHARKNPILVVALIAGLALGGCGPAGTSGGADPSSATPIVSGAAATDATTVALRDSSSPARELSAAPAADGSFSFDVLGLTPPFALRAQGNERAEYNIVTRSGNADVNELTSAAVAGAVGGDDDGAWEGGGMRNAAERMGGFLRGLRTVLKPLFDLYGVTRIGGDDDGGDPSGMRALLRDVSFTVTGGTLVVKNRATGGVIYSAPLSSITSGTFHPENMPPGPNGSPPSATCTYTYSAWNACQSNGTQTRTVASATPAGCTGTPVLTQACTYTPPPPAACTYTYGAWGTCQSNNTQTRTVASATPAGCTGTPVLTQACTYTPPPPAACTYTYGAWGACQSNGTQTRTVASATPAGCTGTPVLTQACTYTPPPPAACTYTYGAWGTCQSNNTQTRTVASATPAGCTGTPVLTQTCTYTPPIDGAALYTQKCAGCHGALATSAVRGRTAAQITAAGMTQGLTAAQVQAVADALK